MGENDLPATGPYRIIAETLPASPIMFKAILESWCYLNCTGTWEATIHLPVTYDGPTEVSLDLFEDDDAILFMLSSEYSYMGRPPVKTLTI